MSIPGLIGALVIALVAMIFFCAYDRWYVPWLARRWFKKLSAVVEPGKPIKSAKPHKLDCTIKYDSTGFTFTQRKWRTERSVVMRWDEIQTVTVSKRDLFIVDCICLFAARADESGIELDEEMCGWKEFVDALPTCLPGCVKWENWYLAMVSPAFAANTTQIYFRAEVQKS